MKKKKETTGGHVCSGDDVDKWTETDFREKRRRMGGGRGGDGAGEDSLAYAGPVHRAFPAPPFHLPLLSLLLFSRNI